MPLEFITPLAGLVGAVLGGAVAYLIAKRQSDAQIEIARTAASAELSIAQEKLRTENKLVYATHEAIRALLSQQQWELRSFGAIKQHLQGFGDDELRKLLVAAGAVSFRERETGGELWGLLERNRSRMEPAPGLAFATRLSAASIGPQAAFLPGQADALPVGARPAEGADPVPLAARPRDPAADSAPD